MPVMPRCRSIKSRIEIVDDIMAFAIRQSRNLLTAASTPRSWIEVTRAVKSLDRAAHAQSDKPRNPPSFGFVIFLTALLPIIGLIMGVVWLGQPRFRSAGGALLAISLVFMLIWCAILFR